MGRASRTRLVATVGVVVVALAALLVGGRLHQGRLARVDPRTLRIDAFVDEPRPVTAVAAGAGAVWASAGAELLRVDPRTAQVTARLPVPTGTAPVAAPGVAAGVWAVCCGADRDLGHAQLTRVDPARNRLAATVRVPGALGATAGSVLVAGGMVLVADPDNGTVHHLGGNRLTEDAFEADGRDVVVDERGVVWVHSDQRLVGFDPGHTRGRSLEEAGGAIRALAAGHDALWVGAPSGLLRVDFLALP